MTDEEIEVPETVSVAVSEVIERLIERQDGAEARVKALEELVGYLAGGLHLCREALEGQQRVLEARDGFVAPNPKKASEN